MSSQLAVRRLTLLVAGAMLLVAASPTNTSHARTLRAAFGDLEATVRAIGRVPTGSTRGPVVLTLEVPDLPFERLTQRRVGPTGRPETSASAGAASSTVAADPTGSADRTARLAVEVIRRFQPLEEFYLWVAIDENTSTDRLTCARPEILGAQGAGRTTLIQVLCPRITISDQQGGSLFSRWVVDTTGVPTGPTPVEFTQGDTRLSAAAIARLRVLLALLTKYKELSLLVAGFAELGEGDPELVGGQRAAAVRDFLLGNGVARSRVTTVSYGAEKPLERDDAGQAWAHNRRAHLTILTGAVN